MLEKWCVVRDRVCCEREGVREGQCCCCLTQPPPVE